MFPAAFVAKTLPFLAVVLRLPIVIVDPALAQWQKIGAFVGPGAVQAYVGNALEPTLFGAFSTQAARLLPWHRHI